MAWIISIVLNPLPAYAHGSITLPEPGKIDFSLFWVPMGGKSVDIWWVENESGSLNAFGYHAVIAGYNAGGAGLDSMIEVGIIPGLSIGMQLNFPQILISGIQGGNWLPRGSLFFNFTVCKIDWFGIQTRFEIEAAPLFGPQENLNFDEGYFNVFLSLEGSASFYEEEEILLAAYLGVKAVTSVENPLYRTPNRDFEEIIRLPPGATDGVQSQLGPIFKIAITPGLEARFGWFIFHIGYNIPIVSFTQFYLCSLSEDAFRSFMQSMEFSWRFRL
jgi:hypothetical protein